MASITINNKNSYTDFDALLIQRDISPPDIKDVYVDIPYLNGDICFTHINNNKPTYNTRPLTYTFEFVDYPKTALRKKVTLFENWIMSSGECEIYDDTDVKYHFVKARPVNCKEAESGFKCTVTVTFKTYPFRVSENYSNAEWDNFCFDTDYLNPAEYVKVENKTTSCHFYNYGINDICPEVEFVPDENSSFDYVVLSNPYSAPITINRNTTKLNGFVLKPGANEFALISGAGTIRLKACEEVI